MKKSSAFSLIELSIVVLIIGIIIAGVTQSSSLLAKAKLQSAQVLTKSSPVAGTPGLVAWFEPTLDESFLQGENQEGAAITQWNDINPQSSSKYFLVHPWDDGDDVTTYRANSGAGGLPSLYFTNSYSETNYPNLELSRYSNASGNCCIAFSVNPEAVTMFAVYLVPDSQDTALYLINSRYSNSKWGEWRYNIEGNRSVYFGVDDGSDQQLESSGTAPQSRVSEIASLTSNGYDVNLYINGTSHISDHPTEQISSQDYPYGDFYLRASAYFQFSELIIFDRPLKKEERQDIEDYLGKKYSINIVHTDTP
jgi:prepilin-type N-terminal cleavage/methylation domain-containing protein